MLGLCSKLTTSLFAICRCVVHEEDEGFSILLFLEPIPNDVSCVAQHDDLRHTIAVPCYGEGSTPHQLDLARCDPLQRDRQVQPTVNHTVRVACLQGLD